MHYLCNSLCKDTVDANLHRHFLTLVAHQPIQIWCKKAYKMAKKCAIYTNFLHQNLHEKTKGLRWAWILLFDEVGILMTQNWCAKDSPQYPRLYAYFANRLNACPNQYKSYMIWQGSALEQPTHKTHAMAITNKIPKSPHGKTNITKWSAHPKHTMCKLFFMLTNKQHW